MVVLAVLTLLPLLQEAAGAPAPERPRHDVELVDAFGERVHLRGFHRALRGSLLRAYRGSAEIEIPWGRVRELEVRPGSTPGGRMQLRAVLDDGGRVDAEFDEMEGEHRFTGFAAFGRASLFFRDIRHLRVIRPDSADIGSPVDEAGRHPVRARVADRQGVVTELERFRRYAGENVLRARRGSMSVAVPLAWIELIELAPDPRSAMLALTVRLRGVEEAQRLQLPIPEEKVLYGGMAPFGSFRIPLGDLRKVEVLEVQDGPPESGETTRSAGERHEAEAAEEDVPGDDPRDDDGPRRSPVPAEEERSAKR